MRTIPARAICFSSLLLFALGLGLSSVADVSPQTVIEEFNRPFLFSYLSWQNKAFTSNGVAVLRGFNNQGGAGLNGEWDLAAKANLIPALRVRVGAGNQAAALVLMLKDAREGEGRWEFPLPSPSGEFVTVSPRNGASLSEPNGVGKAGKPELGRLRQLQLIGDWAGDKALDVEVDAVVLQAPTPEVIAARESRNKQVAAEAEALQKQRVDLKARYAKKTELSPSVEHVSAVASNILAIEIQAGQLIPGKLLKYQAEPSDKKREKKNEAGEVESVELERNGKTLGWLVGSNREWLVTFEAIEGDPLLDFVADRPETYGISSSSDPAFASAVNPLSVGRKSHVNAWAQGPSTVGVRHTLYLKLPKLLVAGKEYTIAFGELNTRQAKVGFKFDPVNVRSEAVHVNQIGYRPDDPVKQAFVSCWLGTGGALTLPSDLKFSLVEDSTGKVLYTGTAERHFPADKPELMCRDANFNGTDVARCDFSIWTKSGRYRVVVEGVGCSYPFDISQDAWTKAFVTQMRGLFHQRSGIELGPPYTSYRRPRDMNPADGYRVTRTRGIGRSSMVERRGKRLSRVIRAKRFRMRGAGIMTRVIGTLAASPTCEQRWLRLRSWTSFLRRMGR